ncbi:MULTISPECIES: hypothetical protein [unclassified Streptomyces]|uniref:hypothetical protein n=1 Tax=unclassified Streptomyces TaxID=2593676 RepID=UPI001F03BDA3|nr:MULTISPECIES: hypothetical protein [unclassified Streptomyces]MCH0566080.1 hypothetical protein [Streptomyces sp. MUM 2J]MCH0567926.1 hypothetical protein [Streptomyces sp. MUM 136J]
MLDGGKIRLSGDARLDVNKAYNFDLGESADLGPVEFSFDPLAAAPHYRLAKNFTVQGSRTIGVNTVVTP